MARSLLCLALLATLGLTSACVAITDAGSFCSAYARAKVDFQIRCLFVDASRKADATGLYEAACLRARDRYFTPVWSFDVERARTCVDTLKAQGCYDLQAACFRRADLPPGKYGFAYECHQADMAANADPAECRPEVGNKPAAEGELCDVSLGCQGSPCEVRPGESSPESLCGTCTGTCTVSTCGATPGCTGEPVCGTQPLGAPCSRKYGCRSGAYCRGLAVQSAPFTTTTIVEGVCTERAPEGAPCIDGAFDDGCAGARGTCLDSVCQDVAAYSRTEGQSCDAVDQCAAGLACTGGVCSPASPTDVLAGISVVHLGEPCGGETVRCGEGICRPMFPLDETPPTCGVPFADGETCTYDLDCKSMRCDGSTKTCAAACQ